MSTNHRNVLDAIADTTVEVGLELFEVALGGSSHAGSSHSSGHGTDNSSSHSSSHGSSHAEGSHQLFGSLESLDSGKWTLSLIIVVCSVLFIEAIFHVVHVFTEDSPFHKVILALEKELMIVGVTAFMFKIILSSIADIDEMWKFSLEIAGMEWNVLCDEVVPNIVSRCRFDYSTVFFHELLYQSDPNFSVPPSLRHLEQSLSPQTRGASG